MDRIQDQAIARMQELALNPNRVAELVEGRVSRMHVYDYLTRKKSMGSHKLQHVLAALRLEIVPEPEPKQKSAARAPRGR